MSASGDGAESFNGLRSSRRCALLDCEVENKSAALNERKLVQTLGYPDGAIEQVTLGRKDAERLLLQLAVALRPRRHPNSPVTGAQNWLTRQSLNRAQSRVKADAQAVLMGLVHGMPDLGAFVVAELKAIEKAILHGAGKPRTQQRTVDRVRRLALVAADTMRRDT